MAMSTHWNKIKWQNQKNFGNTLWKHDMVNIYLITNKDD